MTEKAPSLPIRSLLPKLPADFHAFHQLYRARYVRWAEVHLGSRADAEEAVDCAFEQLAIDWAHVLQQPVPEAYAWKVVKNRTIDAARARKRRPCVVDIAAFETRALNRAVDPIGELEESLSIYRAIAQLPERQFDVIVLRYCLGYDTAHIADVMGITAAGVRSTARYARRRLKQALGLDENERSHDESIAD
ncbi:sigma-70 family RNA polymerase sigma factor [Streptomyces sp. NPDC088146]|uniref:sigma-70 family RNA polymerase sigma factor n=1 Tax=Streptomyces sp. NPDC088146 TaxID=3365829 RepID=UPI003813BEC2